MFWEQKDYTRNTHTLQSMHALRFGLVLRETCVLQTLVVSIHSGRENSLATGHGILLKQKCEDC